MKQVSTATSWVGESNETGSPALENYEAQSYSTKRPRPVTGALARNHPFGGQLSGFLNL